MSETNTQTPAVEQPAPVIKTRSEIVTDCRTKFEAALNTILQGMADQWERLTATEDIPLGYATQPAKILDICATALQDRIFGPLQEKRLTKAEANEDYLRKSPEWAAAVRDLRAAAVALPEDMRAPFLCPESEAFPQGELPEAVAASVRERVSLPHQGIGEVPFPEVRLSCTIGDQAQVPVGSANRAPRAANGTVTGTGNHDQIVDLKTNHKTKPGYECLWDAWRNESENEKRLQAVVDKFKAQEGAMQRIPGKLFGGKDCGNILLTLAKAEGVFDMGLNEGTIPFLRRHCGPMEHEGKPRFLRLAPGKDDVPENWEPLK
jgi:hypothetical protein